MKTLFNALLMSFMLLLGMSCSSNTPESVAKEFTKAIYTADYTRARELSTADSKDVIQLIETLSSGHVEAFKTSNPKVKVVSCDMKVEGEKAVVVLDVSHTFNMDTKKIDTDILKETQTVVKVDDKWLVQAKLK